MSDDDSREEVLKKRRADSDHEDEGPSSKRGRISPVIENRSDDEEEEGEVSHSRKTIEDAIKALDRIQYEFNMGNVFLESPEPSDHDTPPESEDEAPSEEMLNQAHALGYAACIRETFRFLDACGIGTDNDVYQQLKSRFVGITN